MFHHCKIPCTNRPNCEPSKECKIEWKIGMGTGNPVRTSKNIAIDGRGMNLFFVKVICILKNIYILCIYYHVETIVQSQCFSFAFASYMYI